MLILNAALVAILATRGTSVKPPKPATPVAIPVFNAPDLLKTIRTDLESITGAGTVKVSFDSRSGFTARIGVHSFNPNLCTQIYGRELDLRRLFPGVNFDFYFDEPELARALKEDLESISGHESVDVSIDKRTLFKVRIAVPGLNSEIYSRIFDRELEFYRLFPDLNFDFYLWPKPVENPQASGR